MSSCDESARRTSGETGYRVRIGSQSVLCANASNSAPRGANGSTEPTSAGAKSLLRCEQRNVVRDLVWFEARRIYGAQPAAGVERHRRAPSERPAAAVRPHALTRRSTLSRLVTALKRSRSGTASGRPSGAPRRKCATARGVSPRGSTETAITCTRRALAPSRSSALCRLAVISGQMSGQFVYRNVTRTASPRY